MDEKSFKDRYLEVVHDKPYSLMSKGIKKTTIDSIMVGSIPSVYSAYEIAKTFGITVEELLTGKDPYGLNEEKRELLKLWDNLPIEARTIFLKVLRESQQQLKKRKAVGDTSV